MIRQATLRDVDAVAAGYERLLSHEAATHSYTNWKPGIYPVRQDAQTAAENGTLYVLEEAGEICAGMILNQHQAEAYREIPWQYPAPPEEVLVIHTLSMPPEMAGRGYGTRMVRFAMEEAVRRGCTVIRIDTYVGNLPAQRLYQKLGFRISGRKVVNHHDLFESELYYLECDLKGVRPMNETIRQLIARKSVRVFEDRPIPPEAKEAILQAAVNAPTAGNQQLYTILDITDPELKSSLSESCDHQPFIATAQMVLIFLADCRKWYDAFTAAGCTPRDPGAGDLLLAVSDANIAAQNAVTAAESLGIGSCYIGDVMENCETHRRMLELPAYVFPAAMLVFGYPTAQQQEREKPRRAAMKHIVHENAYRTMEAEELREMFLPRCGEKGFEAWMQAFCQRKYNSDFSREMTRSVERYLDDF